MKITFMEKIKVDKMIMDMADEEGVTPAEVRRSMQECIDEAWDNKTPRSAAAWLEYFPNGKKPSLEEFIVCLAGKLHIS